ncbi:MAG: GntR family transcriptional regulator [Polymorphobacter sp.]|uniref:GntR family transcriptional regulator n=1 Tax=Polymorphobacter sp. TaxID=1909290 RepID=UPI003A8792D5
MATSAPASSRAAERASERAYQEIRALILTGDVAPGAPLTEEALADIVGVSRTPVREALRRLEAELYVRRSESQRLFVAEWSRDDLAEMFVLRAMLEAHAAARAATRISAEALAELHRINARISAAASAAGTTPDIAAFLPENRAFHELIIREAASPRLASILATLVEQPLVRHTAIRYSAQELTRSANEHNQLLQAFAARDADWARAIMTAHIRRAYHSFTAAA